MTSNASSLSGYIVLLAVQIAFLIVYAVVVRYDNSLLPIHQSENGAAGEEIIGPGEKKHVPSYPRECYFNFNFIIIH